MELAVYEFMRILFGIYMAVWRSELGVVFLYLYYGGALRCDADVTVCCLRIGGLEDMSTDVWHLRYLK